MPLGMPPRATTTPGGAGGYYQQPQLSPRTLAAGQIAAAATWTTVFTPRRGAPAEIRFVACYNTSAVTTQTVEARVSLVDGSGTVQRQFARASVAPNGSVRFLEGGEVLFLTMGQSLQIQTTTANVLDYVISGLEWVTPTGGGTA